MSDDRTRFDTDVPGIWGYWPLAPAMWSYSSLKEIEACERRWMLSRADYPDIWDRRGYPALPVVAAIFGNVVHRVIDQLTNALGAAGITSPTAADVVGVLGSLGGWRGIVLAAIEHELSRFDGNPRVSADRVDRVRTELVRRAPAAADEVKTFLGRADLPVAAANLTSNEASVGNFPTRRLPAGPGVYAERTVTADSLRITGTIDQLVVADTDVVVTDVKTGGEDDAHDQQVQLYALLWHLDRQSNPTGRPATQLRIAYPSHERSVVAPDVTQLKALEAAAAARVAWADGAASTPPPDAKPGEVICKFCPVKHLCAAYWATVRPMLSAISTDEWFDFEGEVLRPNGSRSWFLATVSEPVREVLVRTVETDVPFPIGQRVRLLGVRRSRDPDEPERLVISMVTTSEWYAAVA